MYEKIINMSENSSSNKRVAVNTVYLYIRMIFIMLVNLYVVRSYLDLLGVEDYGIYNVIGGIVGMLSFLNGTLATSTQRYFSVTLAEGDAEKLNRQFRLNISVFLAFIICAIVLAETIGLWYVNNKMTIPEDRIIASNIIYQFTIVSFVVQLISVPYNALIIAHEQMKTFAFIGVGEALFKILIVLALMILPTDRLILFGFMVMLSSLLVTMCYYMYCKKNYPESKYKYYWNNREAKDVIGFSGWHFLGTLSVAVRGQGVNLLINAFFPPVINAARAVAFQIESAVLQLSGNFFVAVKPQIYKTYALYEMEQFKELINRSTIICVFLVSIISIPFMINVDFVLGLWLKEVPSYTVSFTLLVLIIGLIDATSNPTICAALATKKIKVFYLFTGTLFILTLPISYMFLIFGFDVLWTMYVSIAISIVTVYARAYVLKGLIGFSMKKYSFLLGKLLLVTTIILIIGFSIKLITNNTIVIFFISGIITLILHIVLYPSIVLSASDRAIITTFVKHKILKKK